jgi:hypothetical protein
MLAMSANQNLNRTEMSVYHPPTHQIAPPPMLQPCAVEREYQPTENDNNNTRKIHTFVHCLHADLIQ